MVERSNAEREIDALLDQAQGDALTSMLGEVRKEGMQRYVDAYKFLRTKPMREAVFNDPGFLDRFTDHMDEMVGSPSRASAGVICSLEMLEMLIRHYEPGLDRVGISEKLQQITTEYLDKK